MSWMADTFERRQHPLNLWPEAKSAIILGFNYGPDTDPLANLDNPEKAVISVYARNRDYHDIIKGKLKIELDKSIDVSDMTLDQAKEYIAQHSPKKRASRKKSSTKKN